MKIPIDLFYYEIPLSYIENVAGNMTGLINEVMTIICVQWHLFYDLLFTFKMTKLLFQKRKETDLATGDRECLELHSLFIYDLLSLFLLEQQPSHR